MHRKPKKISQEDALFPERYLKKKCALRIVYFGDAHGSLEGLLGAKRLIESYRSNGFSPDLLLNTGDVAEGGLDITVFRRSLQIMNEMGVDASALGNHEFDYEDRDVTAGYHEAKRLLAYALHHSADRTLHASLTELVDEQGEAHRTIAASGKNALLTSYIRRSNFQWLCANLDVELDVHFRQLAEEDQWLPWTSFTKNGITIPVIGLTTPSLVQEFAYHASQGYRSNVAISSVPPKRWLEQWYATQIAPLSGPVFPLVLSHLGIDQDPELSASELPLILGGHSHSELEVHGKTLICHSGIHVRYVGVVEVFATEEGWRCEHMLVETPQPSSETERSLSPVLTTLPNAMDLRYKNTKSIPLMNLVADALRTATNSDIAFSFPGSVRFGLPKKVHLHDVYRTTPYACDLYTFQLSGKQIRDLLTYMVTRSRNDDPRRSLLLHPSGIHWKIDAEGKVTSIVTDNGSDLDPFTSYTVTLPDYVCTGGIGDDIPAYITAQKGVKQPQSLLHSLVAYLQSNKYNSALWQVQRIVTHPDAPVSYNDLTILY